VPAPVRAATAVYYSPTENVYGWCAGYPTDTANGCARGYCVDAGGTACDLAVGCGGGWGAIALAQSPARGFGASCAFGDAFGARVAALITCAVAANALCWTDTTFTVDGSTMPTSENYAFDIAWYAQGSLQIQNHDPGTADGAVGPKTRAALEAFQTELGRPATGILDDELFLRLLDGAKGAQSLVRVIKRDVVDPRQEELATRTYAFAPSPAPAMTFSEELVQRTEAERLLALATVLASGGSTCSVPALDAHLLFDAADGTWSIECAEGSYTLFLSEGGSMVVPGGSAAPDPEPEPQRAQDEQRPGRHKPAP
jgi:hypothetical protein